MRPIDADALNKWGEEMNCKHICGECKYHKHICNRDYGFMGYSREEWICDNKESDAYSLMTDYNDGCEEFEPKGVR